MKTSEAEPNFEELFNSYYGRLARMLYRIAADRGQAEDAAAEAFWRLYRRPPASRKNLEGWLYRTGVRIALDRLKSEKRRRRYEALAAMFGTLKAPDQKVSDEERRTNLRQTFAALKARQAALIVLRAEGLSYDELAAALEINPRSIGSALARAEQAFRKEYEKRYGKPESD